MAIYLCINISYPYGLMIVCFLVLIVSFVLLVVWIRNSDRAANVAMKYLAFYGGAVAALCLLQLILTKFGYGSDYAVKKYGFGLVTILFINASIVSACYVLRLFGLKQLHLIFGAYRFNGYILAASLCVLFIFSVPGQKLFDVSDVVATERHLVNLRDTVIPVPDRGKYNVVVGLHEFPTINYMYSTAIMRTPKEIAVRDVLLNGISDLSKYSYVISSFDNPSYGASGCESLAPGSISVVRAQCIEQKFAKASDCRSIFDFSNKGSIPSRLLEGFSVPEEHGRWTDGHLAKFSCSNNGAPLKKIKLYMSPFIYGELKKQRLSVSIGATPAGSFELTSVRGKDNPIVIGIPEKANSQKLTFVFEMPDATSPKEVGLNDDPRKIAFSFQSIEFE